MSSGDDRGSLRKESGGGRSREQIYVVDDKIIFCVLACFVSKAKNVPSSHTPPGLAKYATTNFLIPTTIFLIPTTNFYLLQQIFYLLQQIKNLL